VLGHETAQRKKRAIGRWRAPGFQRVPPLDEASHVIVQRALAAAARKVMPNRHA
jgi:hypothetical protein